MSAFAEHRCAAADGVALYYRNYPKAAGPTPVLCLPGLTRNSRDFDFIAEHMAASRRVLTADFRGRGRSGYDPAARYAVPVEAADCMRVLEEADVPKAVMLGTSRGGIVAMVMAKMRPEAVAGIILNDIGAEIEGKGLDRIMRFIGREPPIRNWNEAMHGLKGAFGPAFPDVPDATWIGFAHAIYREEDGRIVPDYDPKLADAVREADKDRTPGGNFDLWPLFTDLSCPLLLLHGWNSDLLAADTVTRMQAAKPGLVAVTVKDRGHVPFLDEPIAVEAIDAFVAAIV